jgi:RNA polymerase sigma-70 factor (ECF subfamily)
MKLLNTKDQQEHKWILESQKDHKQFQHLFNKYYNPIFNYILRRTCNSYITKDITANTFFKALNNIQKFKWKGIPFSAWLYRIATNEIKQHYRKTRRTVALTPEHTENLKSTVSSDSELLKAEEAMQKNEQYQRIHTAVSSLQLKYQNAISLRYFENMSIKEIADILKLSENTVKTHIRRGLKKLKEQL